MNKKIAFVDGNRAINENNVEKHVESLKEFGKNLVPLLYLMRLLTKKLSQNNMEITM